LSVGSRFNLISVPVKEHWIKVTRNNRVRFLALVIARAGYANRSLLKSWKRDDTMKRIRQPLKAARRVRLLASLSIAAGFFLSQPVGAVEGQPLRLDCTPKAFPALNIQGDDFSRYPNGQPAAFRGFADPCLRRDPISDTLWLAYSWPHMEHMGGNRDNFVVGVETHLASSTDGGKTWQRVQVLWPKTPAKFTDPKTHAALDGFISHEVPNMVPFRTDGKPLWVGARLDYFLGRRGNYKARDNRSFCIRLMAAPSPRELSNSPYITFGHAMNSAECAVDFDVCNFSNDFPPLFIPNEPALLFKDGRLYLAFACMTFYGQTPDFNKSFIAIFSTEPQGPIRTWKWRYHGKLTTHREAKELGGESLTQIEFALGRDGQLLVLLTPEAWDPQAAKKFGGDAFGGILHRGCTVVEVASLDPPALAQRKDGTLAVRAFLFSSAQSEQGPGAGAYDPASATGVLFTLRDLSSPKNMSWSLHPTGLHP
jgi:hypothetical protein